MKQLIIYILEILISFVLQSTMFHYIALADVMPNLLLILVVSTAHRKGRIPGMIMGFFCGILVDLMYGSYLIGLSALLYLVIGYFFGYTSRYYSKDDYTLPIVLIAAADLTYGFFYYIFEFLLRGRLDFLYYLRGLILPEIIYTVAVSVFLYKLLNMIHIRLERNPDEEG